MSAPICGYCRREAATCVPNPCAERRQINFEERRIEAYHDGWGMFRRGEARPVSGDERDGWQDAQRASRVVVIMPRRPEGYYHSRPDGEA